MHHELGYILDYAKRTADESRATANTMAQRLSSVQACAERLEHDWKADECRKHLDAIAAVLLEKEPGSRFTYDAAKLADVARDLRTRIEKMSDANTKAAAKILDYGEQLAARTPPVDLQAATTIPANTLKVGDIIRVQVIATPQPAEQEPLVVRALVAASHLYKFWMQSAEDAGKFYSNKGDVGFERGLTLDPQWTATHPEAAERFRKLQQDNK